MKIKAEALKQMDGEFWAIGEMCERVARFMEMSLHLANEHNSTTAREAEEDRLKDEIHIAIQKLKYGAENSGSG